MKTIKINDVWNTAKTAGLTGLLSLTLPLSLSGQTAKVGVPEVRVQPSGNTVQLEIIGDADGYSVEASEDLVNWNPLGEAQASQAGQFVFQDTAAATAGGRFYRIVPREGSLHTAVIVEGYGNQIRTLGYQAATMQTGKAGLERDRVGLQRLLARTQSRINDLEQRVTENPVITQHHQEVSVRWNGHQSVLNDPRAVDQVLQQIHEEREQAAQSLVMAEQESNEILRRMAQLDETIGAVEIQIEALSLAGDELSVSLLQFDDALWNAPCFQHDLKFAEWVNLRAERVQLEQNHHAAQVAVERARVEAESAGSRTWYAFGTDGNQEFGGMGGLLIFDGKRRHFQSIEEGQLYVREVVEPAVEQAKIDARLFDRDAETHATTVQDIGARINIIDLLIATAEDELEQLRAACGPVIDPVQQCQDLSFELLTLEAIREMTFNDKIDAALRALAADERAQGWQSIADQPAGVAVGNETWVFWDGEIFKFVDPVMADEFLQFIESFRQFAAEEAERARAEANDWEQRAIVFCDELDEIAALIAVVKADLKVARAAVNQNVGGWNGQQPAAQRDLLDILIALTEAIRNAVAAEKAAAVRDAENLQQQADRLAAQASTPVSLVVPNDGQPYFIVQGMGGTARIPVVPAPGESMEGAIARTRQAAENLHADLEQQRETARKAAADAQQKADAAKAKAQQLCDELDDLDVEIADLQLQRANAAAAAVAAAKAQIQKAAKGVVDCLKCFFKKIALAAAKSAHAGLVSKANQAEKDATDARKDANAKHDAASKGLSLVINHTDGRAVAAFGDQKFYFDHSNSDDPERDARDKHRDLKAQRDQAKKDADAAEKAAKAAEEAAAKAKDDVKKSQEAIDKCQKELDELKKNCPLC